MFNAKKELMKVLLPMNPPTCLSAALAGLLAIYLCYSLSWTDVVGRHILLEDEKITMENKA